ncbi:hypothetical protein D3C77_296450 [compost metagenome]
MSVIAFKGSDYHHNEDANGSNDSPYPPIKDHEESEEHKDHTQNKRLSAVVRHMNIAVFLSVQGFSCLLRRPKRIPAFNVRHTRKVVVRNRAWRAPFQGPCIPWIAVRLSRRIAEAPVNIVYEYRKSNS